MSDPHVPIQPLPPMPPRPGVGAVPELSYHERRWRTPAAYGYTGSSRMKALRAADPPRVAPAIAAGLTGVSYFLPWVKATVSAVGRRGAVLSTKSSGGNAFAKDLPHLWPILSLVSVAAVIFVCARTDIYNRRAWLVVSAALVAATTYIASNAESSRPIPKGDAGSPVLKMVVHADFQWGFTVTAVLAGVTLLLALVGRARRQEAT